MRKVKDWPLASPDTPRRPSHAAQPRNWRFQNARTLLPKKGPGEENPNSGIDGDGTLLDFDYREVRVSQAIIENARQVYLVTDHTKFSITPMVKLGHIGEVDALFTDRPPSAEMMQVLAETKTRLFVADAEETRR